MPWKNHTKRTDSNLLYVLPRQRTCCATVHDHDDLYNSTPFVPAKAGWEYLNSEYRKQYLGIWSSWEKHSVALLLEFERRLTCFSKCCAENSWANNSVRRGARTALIISVRLSAFRSSPGNVVQSDSSKEKVHGSLRYGWWNFPWPLFPAHYQKNN